MATSTRDFNAELYSEHIEEASFLYEQRLAYLADAELAWRDLREVDDRLEAHLDALVVGGEHALRVCAEQTEQGDFGELHAALRVFCRQGGRQRVYALLRDLNTEDVHLSNAVGDALKAECPSAWYDELASIAARHIQLAPILATALGYRRAKAERALLAALAAAPDGALIAPLMWALGRVGGAPGLAAVEKHVRSEEPAISAAACTAAVRLGSDRTVRYCLLAAQTRPWMTTALALGGDRAALNVLLDLAGSDRVTDEVLIGLGLLGDLKAVRAIFDCLALPDRAAAAASALQLITGADLMEEVFIPDAVDPDELFDEEREHYEATGELPKRADGQSFGSTAVQLVTDQAVWKGWLSQNKARFDPSARYRYGELYSPRSLLKSLLAERVPSRIRGIVCDELRARYGVDFPLEVDMPAVEQHRLLVRLGEWVQVNDAKFKPGAWYFHGRTMT